MGHSVNRCRVAFAIALLLGGALGLFQNADAEPIDSPEPPINLIADPSFEEGTGGWYGGEMRRTSDAAFVRTGRFGLSVRVARTDKRSRWMWDFASPGMVEAAGVPLWCTQGSSYVASVSVKGIARYQGVRMIAVVPGQDGGFDEERVSIVTGEWQRLSCRFTATSEDLFFSVLTEEAEKGEPFVFALDDFVVRETASGGADAEILIDLDKRETERIAAQAHAGAVEPWRDKVQIAALLVLGLTVFALMARAPFFMLLALPLVGEFGGYLPDFDLAGVNIGVDGAVNLAALAGGLTVLSLRHPAVARKPVAWIAAAFLLVCGLSLLWSTNPFFGFRQWINYASYVVVFGMACAARSQRFARALIWVSLLIAVGTLLIGGAQFLWVMNKAGFAEMVKSFSGNAMNWRRLDGFKDYPQAYADMLLVLFPIAIGCALFSKQWAARTGFLGLAALMPVALIATGTRSAMVAFVIEVAVLCAGLKRFLLLALFLALFTAVGFASGVFQQRTAALLHPNPKEQSSLESRKELWRAIDAAIVEHPIRGHGLGSVEQFTAGSPYAPGVLLAAHCDYRKFLFETGIPGLALWTALMFGLVGQLWRRGGAVPLARYLALGSAASGCAWMTIALVDGTFQVYTAMMLWWMLAGAAIGLTDPENNEVASQDANDFSTKRLCADWMAYARAIAPRDRRIFLGLAGGVAAVLIGSSVLFRTAEPDVPEPASPLVWSANGDVGEGDSLASRAMRFEEMARYANAQRAYRLALHQPFTTMAARTEALVRLADMLLWKQDDALQALPLYWQAYRSAHCPVSVYESLLCALIKTREFTHIPELGKQWEQCAREHGTHDEAVKAVRGLSCADCHRAK